LVDALGKAKGVTYTTKHFSVEEAAMKEERAKLEGGEIGEMMWSIRPLIASGLGVTDGVPGSKLDNELFDFTPETMVETFDRLYK
jgi:hypothetical protein